MNNKKSIFGESEKVWEMKRKRLESELEEKELPPARRVEVEANLYFINCILREFKKNNENKEVQSEQRN